MRRRRSLTGPPKPAISRALAWVLGALALALGLAGLPLPAGGQAVAARPAGLVQAGNSKTACIYVALGEALHEAEKVTGITYRCLVVYVTGSKHWKAWQDPWILQPDFGYVAWVKDAPRRHTLVLTMDLVPNGAAHARGWRVLAAEGHYVSHAKTLARNLVKAGLGYAVIRLGPEMNGPWEADWVGSSRASQRAWARAFARTVTAMRSVRGAHFLFDWNVNAGYKDIPLANYYPGNAFVDIVGIDAYDEAPIPLPAVGSATRWSTLVHEPLGLLEVYAFARRHHKPASIPEWGTLRTSGDDGPYVRAMGAFVATHVIAYEAWYDAGNKQVFELAPKTAPRSLAAYRAQFSRRG